MLNRGCQNREKQVCKNVHEEPLSKYKSKDIPNLKGGRRRLKRSCLDMQRSVASDLDASNIPCYQHLRSAGKYMK